MPTSRVEFVVDGDGFVSEETVVAVGEGVEDSARVVTRFTQRVDEGAKTVTVSQTGAVGTPAQSTTSTVSDRVTGLELSVTDPTGRVASSTYDRAGRVLTQTAPGNLRTSAEYGDRVTRVTDPSGVSVGERVDVLGRVVEVTDNIGVDGEGTFGPKPGVERVIEKRAYERNASVVRVTDARGRVTVTVTDVFGRPLSVEGPSGVVKVSTYDDVANTVTTGVVPRRGAGFQDALQVTTTRMDDSNRDVEVSGVREDKVRVPGQSVTYDGLGRTTGTTGDDVSTSAVLNADGTLKSSTAIPTDEGMRSGGAVTADREHDGLFGVSVKKTLSRSGGEARAGVSRVLDAGGRPVSVTDQRGDTVAYAYTVDGLVSEARNSATGVVTRYTYDPVTRDLMVTETAGADGVGSRTAYEYDRITGNVVSVCDADDCDATRIRSVYDVFGNVTKIVYPDGASIGHVFDEFGRKMGTTDIGGNGTEYSYDRFGLLEEVTQTSSDGVVLGQAKYVFDDFGRMTQLSYGNGILTRYTFTSVNEIATETTTRGETLIRAGSYEYDPYGNLTQRVDTRGDRADDSQPAVETTQYTYDAHDRLVESVVYPGAITKSVTEMGSHHRNSSVNAEAPETGVASVRTVYEVGVAGEVTKETTTIGGSTTMREFEYNVLGQTTAVTTSKDAGEPVRVEQKYDAAGNLTHAIDGTTYTYNLKNQAVTETRPDMGVTAVNGSDGPTIIENNYWATGQLRTVATTAAGLTGQARTTSVGTYWDASTLINDTHTTINDIHTTVGVGVTDTTTSPTTVSDDAGSATSGGSVTGSYLVGASRHARTVSGNNEALVTQYYVTDRHGNITALTDTSGNVAATYQYADYGKTTQHTPEHTTPELGEENPFQYAGEYTKPDGKQLLGARTYDPTVFAFTTKDTANQFNLYSYANSNPVVLIDPTGQTAMHDIMNMVTIGVAFITMVLAAANVFAGVVAGAWAAVGIEVIDIAIEGVATGFALAALGQENSETFINPTAETLTFIGFGLALAGLFHTIGRTALTHTTPLPPQTTTSTTKTTTVTLTEHTGPTQVSGRVSGPLVSTPSNPMKFSVMSPGSKRRAPSDHHFTVPAHSGAPYATHVEAPFALVRVDGETSLPAAFKKITLEERLMSQFEIFRREKLSVQNAFNERRANHPNPPFKGGFEKEGELLQEIRSREGKFWDKYFNEGSASWFKNFYGVPRVERYLEARGY